MRAFAMVILVALGLAAAGAYLAMFIVHQNQQALVLEFGKPKRIIDQAGLHWKIPVVETVEYFDKRILDLDTSPQELFSSDQNKLIVDSFARYRIVDALGRGFRKLLVDVEIDLFFVFVGFHFSAGRG